MSTPARLGQAILGDATLGVVDVLGAFAASGAASVGFSGTVEKAGAFVSAGQASVAFAGRAEKAGQTHAQAASAVQWAGTKELLGTGVSAGSAVVSFVGTKTSGGSSFHASGQTTVAFNATTIQLGRFAAVGQATVAFGATRERFFAFAANGQATVAWAGLKELLGAFHPAGTSQVAFYPHAEWAGRFAANGVAIVVFNGQSLQADTIPQVQGIGRVRVDVYDTTGAKLNYGPIAAIMQCKYRGKLNEIGSFELTVPADEERLQYIGHRYELHIYREGEGKVFVGEVGNIEYRNQGDAYFAVISGSSVARKLVRYNTLMGQGFNGTALASTVTTLLTSTGWTAGSIAAPATTLLAEYNGLSRWAALAKSAELFGLHLRENPLAKTVDIGAFGAISGLTFQNVEQASPVLRQNPNFAPISNVRIVEDSHDLITKMVPIGGGEGLNLLTLKWSTRSSPYTIQNATGPDGQLYHYIEDAAATAAYGLTEEVVSMKDAIPLANSLAGFQNASNAMYDIAATRLTRKKAPIQVYEGQVVGLRHIVNGVETFKLGDKVLFRFHGVMQLQDGTKRAIKTVNANVWIMGYERTLNSDGSDSWQFTISNVDMLPETPDNLVAQRFEAMHALEVSKRNYTFQAPYILQRISIESGSTATLYAKLDSNISLLHLAKLSITVRPLRSNVEVASSGGGTTSSSGSSHSHSVSGQTASGGGSHSHDINPGFGSVVTQVGVKGFGGSDPAGQLAAHNHASATTDSGGGGGGAHSHTVSGATGTPGTLVSNQNFVTTVNFPDITQTETNHTHSVTATTSGAETSHTHTVSAHTHGLTYGIFVGSNPVDPDITVNINGVDRTVALGGPFNTVNSEFTLDITQYLQSGSTEQPNRATNTIVFGTDVLCDIEAILRLDLTRSALLPV